MYQRDIVKRRDKKRVNKIKSSTYKVIQEYFEQLHIKNNKETPACQAILHCREKLGIMDKLAALIYANYNGVCEQEQLLTDI